MGLLDGLISFYSFEGNANDAHGSNDGSANGGLTFAATGKVGNCGDFDSLNDSVTIPDDNTLDLTNITVAAWVKLETMIPTHDYAIMAKGATDFKIILTKYLNPSTPINLKWVNTGFSDLTSSIGWAYFADNLYNTWAHIVCAYGGSGFKIYINGSLDVSDAQTGDLSTNASDIIIGNINSGSDWFGGPIDEVGIWNRELTTTEISDLYNGGSGLAYGSFTSTVAGPTAVPAVIAYDGIIPTLTGGTLNLMAPVAEIAYDDITPPVILIGYIINTPSAVVAYAGDPVPGFNMLSVPAAIDYNCPVPTITGGTQNMVSVPAVIAYGALGVPTFMLAVPAAVIPYDAIEPSFSEFTINFNNAFIIYKFYLTGSADGVSDIEIPIESFQSRLRDGTPTYLSVTIKGLSYASAIAARSNGDMVVKMGFKQNGVIYQLDEIIKVDLEDITTDEGAVAKSINLVGHRTQTTSPKAVTITDINYRRIKGSEYTIRTVKPDIYLRPGDTVTDPDGNTFVAGLISHTMKVGLGTMEISSRAQ